FETLADAERWAEAVRRHYPNAFATVTPVALLRPANSEASSLPPADSQSVAPQGDDRKPINEESLTDTQVLRILETRRVSPVQADGDERNCDRIAWLRPDDPGPREALKEAVVRGAPVPLPYSYAGRWNRSTSAVCRRTPYSRHTRCTRQKVAERG